MDIIKQIKQGKVFIYPTDTIYGIGCIVTNRKAVKRIRNIKRRENKPFSVIVPGKAWILRNCIVNKEVREALKKLPGPYTLILELKRKIFPGEVNLGLKTMGVRIPRHWISDIVKKVNRPIITTSVNKAGKSYMTSIYDLDKGIYRKVDFMIYEGILSNKPSTIINLIEKNVVKR